MLAFATVTLICEDRSNIEYACVASKREEILFALPGDRLVDSGTHIDPGFTAEAVGR